MHIRAMEELRIRLEEAEQNLSHEKKAHGYAFRVAFTCVAWQFCYTHFS